MIQFLHKKKDKFNAKLRKRKFKLRVTNKKIVSNASYNRTISPFPWLWGLRVRHACRVKFKTFIGTQKALMVTKNKVQIRFNKYPNFFVTKKSSKSRMGKGKGKIVGRILKVHKGETIFNIRFKNFFKCRRWVKAIKGTVPSKSTLVNSS
jgi:ribosomal protein L16/L10AE